LIFFSNNDILDGPGLRIPWQNDSKDIFDNLSNQERYDITHEAQVKQRISFKKKKVEIFYLDRFTLFGIWTIE